MPSNHTMFQHKAARCSLSCAAPRAPASHLPIPTGRHRHLAGSVCANIQCTPVSAPRSCHTVSAMPRVIPPGVIQAAVPGDACRAPERSCGKATALPWRRLHLQRRHLLEEHMEPCGHPHPSWPPSRRHRALPCTVWLSPMQATCSARSATLFPQGRLKNTLTKSSYTQNKHHPAAPPATMEGVQPCRLLASGGLCVQPGHRLASGRVSSAGSRREGCGSPSH